MNRHFFKTLSIVTFSLVAAGAASSAFAETEWERNHPRRDEVEDRLERQNQRIHEEVKEGDMSQGEAMRLHREDQRILQEERRMAAQNNGGITKEQQRRLNQQENSVSQQIGN